MADALCGPSNPLQSFRKHTQLDRSLQQDRLVAQSQQQNQGFRTLDPRAGSLDAELLAFEHGTGPAPAHAFGLQPHTPSPVHAPPLGAQGGWAADFQRLHISQTPSPGPIPVQQFRTEAPLVRSSGWGGEFMRAQQQQHQHISNGKEVLRDEQRFLQQPQPQQSYDFMNGSGMLQTNMPYSPSMQQPQAQMGFSEQQQQQQQHQDPQVSQADFDAAFDEAMAEVEKMQEIQTQHVQDSQPQSSDETTSLEKSDIRIGSDTIDYTEQANRTPDQDQRDADELARTAGQLLNLVQHDTSDKFQNSQFLELMRKIRDREVEVQDNDLQNTGSISMAAKESQISAEPPGSETRLRPNQTPHSTTETSGSAADIFSFPSIDEVYDPDILDFDPDSAQATSAAPPASSWQPAPMQQPPQPSNASDADAMYHSAADEYPYVYPQSELHPGGRYYPEMSPRMSGARRFSVGRATGEGRGGEERA
jgi:hypothetical protein